MSAAMPRLQRTETLFVIIDVQEKLLPLIDGGEAVVRNLDRLVRGFHVLDIPIVVTEQYTKGLGTTVSALRNILTETVGYSPIEKSTFSPYRCGEFQGRLLLGLRKPAHGARL